MMTRFVNNISFALIVYGTNTGDGVSLFTNIHQEIMYKTFIRFVVNSIDVDEMCK